jgi:hypothetical protein
MEVLTLKHPYMGYAGREEPMKELDYLAVGDFNKFFQIAVDSAMAEQLYLAECRESHCEFSVEIDTPWSCGCTIL